MGATDADGIYSPDHDEVGWDDEVNQSFTLLARRITKTRQLFAAHYGGNLAVPNGTSRGITNFVAAPNKYDPMSAFQAGDYDSLYTGETCPAGGWFRLPAGLWAVQTFGVWDADTTGERIVEGFHIDSRMTLPDIDPVFGQQGEHWQMLSNAVYHRADLLPANRSMGTLSFFLITPEMIAASAGESPAGSGWAFTVQVWQNSGSQRTLVSWAVVVARVG